MVKMSSSTKIRLASITLCSILLFSTSAFSGCDKIDSVLNFYNTTWHSGDISTFCVTSDGNSLVTSGANDSLINIWDISTGALKRTIKSDDLSPGDLLSVTNNNHFIVSGGAGYIIRHRNDNTDTGSIIKVWNFDSGTLQYELLGPAILSSIALSPDNKMLAAMGFNTIDLWDLDSGSKVKSLKDDNFNIFYSDLYFSQDSKFLVCEGSNFTVKNKIWDISNGEKLYIKANRKYLPDKDYRYFYDTANFHGSARDLIKLWNSYNELEWTAASSRKYLLQLNFSPDSRFIIGQNLDYKIIVTDLMNRKKQIIINGRDEIVIGLTKLPGDGSIIFMDWNNWLHILRGSDGELLRSFPLSEKGRDSVPAWNSARGGEDVKSFSSDIQTTIPAEKREPVLSLVTRKEPGQNGLEDILPQKAAVLELELYNTGLAEAENIIITVTSRNAAFISNGKPPVFSFPLLKPKSSVSFSVGFYPGSNPGNAELTVVVKEKESRYGLSRSFSYQIKDKKSDDPVPVSPSVSESIEEIPKSPAPVDRQIPVNKRKNVNAIALLIGIDDYYKFPSVKYAANGVAMMRKYLKSVFGYEDFRILPGPKRIYWGKAILKQFLTKELPLAVNQDSSSDIFIYFQGHGTTLKGSSVLIPYDATPDNLTEESVYPLRDFINDINNIPARKRIVVVDACFSGKMGDGTNLIENVSFTPPPVYAESGKLSLKNGQILLSSEGNQYAHWFEEKQQSMFTFFFLAALKHAVETQKKTVITLGDLQSFINDEKNGLPYWSYWKSSSQLRERQRAVFIGNPSSLILRWE